MAIGYQALTETRDRPAARQPAARPRLVGAGLIGCGIASLVLLVAHPGAGGSPALGDVLRSEAAQATADAFVHGGFVLVLSLELVGFAALAVRVGPRKTSVLAAMLFALVGSGLLAASMVVDGLITPGVAARYAFGIRRFSLHGWDGRRRSGDGRGGSGTGHRNSLHLRRGHGRRYLDGPRRAAQADRFHSDRRHHH